MPTQEQWAEATDALAWFCFRGAIAFDRQPDAERMRKIGGALYSKLQLRQTKRAEIPRIVDHIFEWLDGPPPAPDNSPTLGGRAAR